MRRQVFHVLSFVIVRGESHHSFNCYEVIHNASYAEKLPSGTGRVNEGVEKPNSEPGGRDLESYFCRCCLSCHGTVSFLI